MGLPATRYRLDLHIRPPMTLSLQFSFSFNLHCFQFYAKYHRNLRLILHSEEKSNLDDFEKCKTVRSEVVYWQVFIETHIQIKISEIDEILTGKDCPHVKVKTRKQNFVNQVIFDSKNGPFGSV